MTAIVAKVKWSRDNQEYVVTKFWKHPDKRDEINWTEFMSEEQLLAEKANGMEVEYYE
jgi:hypothetical protein